MGSRAKLGDFLREVSNWSWEDFVRAEKDKGYTTNEAIIFALVRSCAMQKIDAIKISLNRLDGKLATPVVMEMPKIFYLYPYATLAKGPKKKEVDAGNPGENPPIQALEKADHVDSSLVSSSREPAEGDVEDLPTMTIRQTLSKMSDFPRELPEAIITRATEVEQAIRNHHELPMEVPRVKSVMAANLLQMAMRRDIEALYEVFDQIDGKLVETIKVGEDMYITSFATEAPPDAVVNEDGILQLEAEQVGNMWAAKLEQAKVRK